MLQWNCPSTTGVERYDNITQWKDLENDHNSSLLLKPSNLKLLVSQFNTAITESSTDEKNYSSRYCDNEEMLNIEIPHKRRSLSLFYINTFSLNKNFDDL